MNKHFNVLPVFILLILIILSPKIAFGQYVRKSQRGMVSQTIAKTDITIIYSRPVARGRELFGALVPFDKVWMPGANEATTIAFNEDVLVNDKPLAKGKYSLWAIPGKEEWTFIFNKDPDAWHSKYPEGQDVLRIKVKSETGSHMEVMAYYFPLVGPDSATLNFHWGKTIVPIQIKLN